MSPVLVSPDVFGEQIRRLLRQAPGFSLHLEIRLFHALFGVSPRVCAILYNDLGRARPRNGLPKHFCGPLIFLYFALKIFLKGYFQRTMTLNDLWSR